MSTELDFLHFWNKKYSTNKLISQFRPQKHLYLFEESDIIYREWLKIHGFRDYKADYLLQINKGWIKGITVEIDGSGGKFSHGGAGSERDRRKSNQFLKLGYLTMRFSVTTLKSNFQYVEDEIKETYQIVSGKKIE